MDNFFLFFNTSLLFGWLDKKDLEQYFILGAYKFSKTVLLLSIPSIKNTLGIINSIIELFICKDSCGKIFKFGNSNFNKLLFLYKNYVSILSK